MRFPTIDMRGADVAVTGAAPGIGLTTAKAYAPRVPTSRSATSTAACSGRPPRAETIPCFATRLLGSLSEERRQTGTTHWVGQEN